MARGCGNHTVVEELSLTDMRKGYKGNIAEVKGGEEVTVGPTPSIPFVALLQAQ